ncbi:MAG: hypothetical protein H6865_01290 [Rhodospirillales bacterium]|nr:hypothetical protein [Rhodospirillales bacterium]
MNNNFGRNLMAWLGVILVLGFIYSGFVQNHDLTGKGAIQALAYSDLA